MGIGQLLGFFIGQPLLALLPAAAFAGMFAHCRRPVVFMAALAWLAYAPYELAMKLRLLCTGDCNIRVDLLLVFPLLAGLSLLGIVVYLHAMRRRAGTRRTPPAP